MVPSIYKNVQQKLSNILEVWIRKQYCFMQTKKHPLDF
jgi:hypothetical protein